jgi:hypothetical protein
MLSSMIGELPTSLEHGTSISRHVRCRGTVMRITAIRFVVTVILLGATFRCAVVDSKPSVWRDEAPIGVVNSTKHKT